MLGINMMLWFAIATCLLWNQSSARLSIALVDGKTESVSTELLTSRISGGDRLCVDVKEGKFRNGQSVILWQCKSSEEPNQLWTFGSDGTIRSNGKCLTTSGHTCGSNIIIMDCDLAPLCSILWEFGDNGEIVHRASRLVLSAVKDEEGFQLTLESNVYSSFQTWRIDNNTQPRSVSIKTPDGFCMQEDGGLISLAYCDSSSGKQKWLLYSDGTIRNSDDRERCLSYDNLIDRNVVSLSCHMAPSSQRWIFTDNGTILNPRVNLVMDVKQSAAGFTRVVVAPLYDNPNQKWELANHLLANV